jgi:hypothetical protein
LLSSCNRSLLKRKKGLHQGNGGPYEVGIGGKILAGCN